MCHSRTERRDYTVTHLFPSSSSAAIASPASLLMSLSSASDTSRLCDRSDRCCRICLSRGKGFLREPLLTPCHCRGTIGLVHKSCLETWLTVSRSDACDLCACPLRLEKKSKPLSCWFTDSDSRVRCYLLTDVISFFFLTPMTLLSLQLCMRGLAYYAKSRLDTAGLLLLITLLITTYLLWLATCLVQHLRNWKQWRTDNVVFRLREVVPEPTPSQTFRVKEVSARCDVELYSPTSDAGKMIRL